MTCSITCLKNEFVTLVSLKVPSGRRSCRNWFGTIIIIFFSSFLWKVWRFLLPITSTLFFPWNFKSWHSFSFAIFYDLFAIIFSWRCFPLRIFFLRAFSVFFLFTFLLCDFFNFFATFFFRHVPFLRFFSRCDFSVFCLARVGNLPPVIEASSTLSPKSRLKFIFVFSLKIEWDFDWSFAAT